MKDLVTLKDGVMADSALHHINALYWYRKTIILNFNISQLYFFDEINAALMNKKLL